MSDALEQLCIAVVLWGNYGDLNYLSRARRLWLCSNKSLEQLYCFAAFAQMKLGLE